MARTIDTLLARPWWLVAVLLLLCAAAGHHLRELRVGADLSGLIAPQSSGVRALVAYQTRFAPLAGDEVLLVSTQDRGPLNLTALEDLVLDLQFLSGVADVVSLFSLTDGHAAGLADLRKGDPLLAQVLSADLSATLVLVIPAPGADYAALGARLDALTHPDLTIANAGLGAVHRAIGQALLSDLRVLTPLATLICAAVTALLFRSLGAVVICALPPLTGLLWTLGWMAATGRAIDPMMGALPVVLIVLGFSDCMHLFHAARRASGPDARARIARALADTLPAAALTSLTTAIAFGALLLADAPSVRNLGQAGIAGMGLSLLAFALLTPVLLLILPAGRRAMPAGLSLPVRPALHLARRGWRVALASLCLLLALAVVQAQGQVGFRYAEYLPTDSPVAQALTRAEGLGLGTDQIHVVVEGAPVVAVPPGPGPDNLRAAVQAIWGAGQDGTSWLAPLDDPRLLARIAATDGSGWALPVQLPITARDTPATAAIEDLTTRLNAAGLSGITHLVGASHTLLQEGPRLVETLRTGLYATILAVTLLIGLAFRSWRLAAVALVPNLIPIMAVESALVLSGRELTIMTAVALTVAFGIAVDDTLHLLNRFRLARGSVERRVQVAIHRATPPMFATTVIVVAGLLVTAASAIPGIATFGALIALAVGLALLADLFLLPGLIRWAVR